MTKSMVAIVAILLSPLAVASEQPKTNRAIASALSDAILSSLVNPRGGGEDFRVGIVNQTIGTALMVSRNGGPARVQHFRGEGELYLPMEIARRLNDPAITELRVPIVRKQVSGDECPPLPAAIEAFYKELNSALEIPIQLQNPTPKERGGNATMDSVQYLIRIATSDSYVEISPWSWLNTPLQQRLEELQAVASRCAHETEGTIVYGSAP